MRTRRGWMRRPGVARSGLVLYLAMNLLPVQVWAQADVPPAPPVPPVDAPARLPLPPTDVPRGLPLPPTNVPRGLPLPPTNFPLRPPPVGTNLGARIPLPPDRVAPPAAAGGEEDAFTNDLEEAGAELKFNSAPMDMVLDEFAKATGRTLLQAPNLPKVNLTLRSQTPLTRQEYLQAIETVLSMHGVGLLRIGEKFLKVVPVKEARQLAMEIQNQRVEPVVDPVTKAAVTNATGGIVEQVVQLEEGGQLVSQMVPLKYIDLAEAKKAIDPIKHPSANIHTLETRNSLLITDTAENINRMMQVLSYIDVKTPAREVPTVIQIRYAKAADIKRRLEEIIAASEKEQQRQAPSTVPRPRTSGPPGVIVPPVPSIPGVIRPPKASETEEPTSVQEILEEAERGIIRGKVLIVADDRTNVLIIITRPENLAFFEKIIKVLDVETAPDVMVRVFRLEYAEAKTVAAMLNDLIGAAKKDEPKAAPGTPGETVPGKSAELKEFIERKPATPATAAEARKSKIGELSKENIKILADERTNSLIIMASREDLLTLDEIVRDMDKMLSQVLIESVILEIELGDKIESGVDWVQRAMIAYNQTSPNVRKPIFSFAGGGGGGDRRPVDATVLNSASDLSVGSGLTYFFTYFGLNMDAVIKMASTDSRTRIISSPVIVTHDNKEAKIDSSEERYFYKGQRYVGTGTGTAPVYEPDVERRKVGIRLTVKPHINERKLVVMEVAQQVEQVAGSQRITGGSGQTTDWPIVLTREMTASIAVQNRETIILGGLVKQRGEKKGGGIPWLRKVPLVGSLFGSRSSDNQRSEIVVFITPYVMDSPQEIADESVRRKGALDVSGLWREGWSASRLAEPDETSSSGRKRLMMRATRLKDALETLQTMERETPERRTAASNAPARAVSTPPPDFRADGRSPGVETQGAAASGEEGPSRRVP